MNVKARRSEREESKGGVKQDGLNVGREESTCGVCIVKTRHHLMKERKKIFLKADLKPSSHLWTWPSGAHAQVPLHPLPGGLASSGHVSVTVRHVLAPPFWPFFWMHLCGRGCRCQGGTRRNRPRRVPKPRHRTLGTSVQWCQTYQRWFDWMSEVSRLCFTKGAHPCLRGGV